MDYIENLERNTYDRICGHSFLSENKAEARITIGEICSQKFIQEQYLLHAWKFMLLLSEIGRCIKSTNETFASILILSKPHISKT